MIKHYDSLVFSKIVKDKDYSFSNPVFGKSNTDQSFYEPSGSFVSNQTKIGASAMTHLHNGAENDISEVRKNCSFLPQGMTQEEIQAMILHQEEIAKSAINDVNSKINEIKDEVNLKNKIVQNSEETE